MRRWIWRALLFVTGATLFAQPKITGVGNAAGGAAIAPGSWVTIYGSGLGSTTRSWTNADIVGGVLPTVLDNTSVLIGGKKAAIGYISPTQLNVLAPGDLTAGTVDVQVSTPAGSGAAQVKAQLYSPVFFTYQGKYASAVHNTDGVYVGLDGILGGGTTTRPAMPGEIVQIYGTGFGPTTPAAPSGQTVTKPVPIADASQLKVTLGGTDAVVQYAGLVGPGLYQFNVVVPIVADGDQALAASMGGIASASGVSVNVRNAGRQAVRVTLGPSGRTIRCGTTLQLTASVTNTQDQSIIWQVNGVAGGSAAVGTVSPSLLYTAPNLITSTGTVTISAISHFDPTVKADLTVTLQNPLPVVTGVSPNPLNPGAATITVTGTGFANGAVIYWGGNPLTTTFVSDTKLTAATTLAMPVGRLGAVKVTNPNPGTATSAVLAIPVRPAAEKLAYADAVRFLRLATWGGTPQDVADLQASGTSAWLAAQFAAAASKWPDPNTTTEGVSRLQTAFWNVALSGKDPLRQRMAFALSQIVVVSAVKDVYFQQMVPYLRLLGDSAFTNYRDVLTSITLHPSMGDFLDMVNNDKANPATGTVANENYARELLQLFSIGLTQLDSQGRPLLSGGAEQPVYDQTTIAELAKVMTGWTYAPTPGFNSVWRNMTYYFAPMVAFEDHHDTTEKRLNLPAPCVIPAGGTAASDLNAVIDCVAKQPNLAPFISYRLIQRFVMSDPSPAYVGRVAAAFQSSGGNLKQVLTAILTDEEALAPGTGKLDEPVLYATGLLRALNAAITAPDSLTSQATAMGQTPLSPSTVFNYYLPSYRVPTLQSQPVAPEFQILNDATALARANFAYRVITNGISSGIVVDTKNLQDLANTPADLVEAVNQALFAGEMDPAMRAILTTAANGSTNTLTRVRSVIYAATASPQYQVQH